MRRIAQKAANNAPQAGRIISLEPAKPVQQRAEFLEQNALPGFIRRNFKEPALMRLNRESDASDAGLFWVGLRAFDRQRESRIRLEPRQNALAFFGCSNNFVIMRDVLDRFEIPFFSGQTQEF